MNVDEYIGNPTGLHTGNVIGELTGNVTGNLVGNVTGTVIRDITQSWNTKFNLMLIVQIHCYR